MRHYIANSSIFDSRPYDVPRIKAAVKRSGASNVRCAYAFGWNNQPHVVTFNGDPKAAELAVAHELDTAWIIVREKDWK